MMDGRPHLRIDDSVFIVAQESADEVVAYFNGWGEKVCFHRLKVVIDEKEILDEIQVGEEQDGR